MPSLVLRATGATFRLARPSTQLTHPNRKGGPLAVTDANLILGRLIPDFFPKIFGKSAKEPLDANASRSKFEELLGEVNATYEKKLDLDEMVYGYVVCLLYGLMLVLTATRAQVYQGRERDDVQADSGVD